MLKSRCCVTIGGMRWDWFWRVALVLAVVAHLVTLYLPGSPEGPPGAEIPYLDKVVHVIAFGVPTFFACLVTRRSWPVWVLVLHVPVSEFIQGRFIPLRSADPSDAVADIVGILLGWLAYRRVSRRMGTGQWVAKRK